jgi:hypothetical protein
MTIRRDSYERFEAYTNGQLSEAERQQLEITLLVDPVMQEEYAQYVQVTAGLAEAAEVDMRKRLKALDKSLGSPVRFTKRFGVSRIKTLASFVALAAVLAGIWILFPKGYSSSLLPHEEGLPVLMDGSFDRRFGAAMSTFRSLDYTGAAVAFSGLSDAEKSDTVLFYLANAELRAGNPAIAMKHFRRLSENSTSVYCDKSKFYVAMCLWSAGNTGDAIVLLEEVASNPEHPYGEVARIALEKME